VVAVSSSLLCAAGSNQGVGFDPSDTRDADGEQPAAGLTIVREPYPAGAAGPTPDLVCCRHVLEHIAAPRDFLRSVHASLAGRGDTVVFFEVPNAACTFRDLAVWDIIYEHCSYFTAPSLRRLFEAVGFTVLQTHTAFENQFLCLEAAPRPPLADSRGDEPLRAELATDVETFEQRLCEKTRAWSESVARLLDDGRRLAVWGAGSKAVTFLNLIEPARRIDYVVDVNPRKHGAYVAGTGQPIVGPEFVQRARPDTVLVMNAAYTAEIRDTLAGLGIVAEVIEV
jgi:hypothetical protein